ncbi:hypothetical protein CAPTEDRAFT_227708 [Capitella teleta]|uniref:RNase H type-1 domain-containing protein n=1 Tax=Capitella teleta TaxID=283909 RepID=R7TPP6_CAPTE|nr:hypothetical protein CAPTEDRAFT_227708 [Capitella teleta]|eukprot:ELT95634.1 hypothetical protein CAPTEDRAFT_227708 [Capitella teleta]
MSVYTAELIAINETLTSIALLPYDEFVICTDSLSSILAISSIDLIHPYVQSILQKCTCLAGRDKRIIFIWCPSHVGIPGNETADTLAKQALGMNILNCPIPHTDFKPITRSFVKTQWQSEWDQETGNKLHDIQPDIGSWPPCQREKRREEIVIARVRIGHTFLTHSHLLSGNDAPMGKEEGHDIDLLLSHPTQGQDADLLTRLLVTLEEKGLIVYGKHEQSTFAENISHKGAALKSSLDHFEKWLGIVKLPGKAPHQLNTTIEKSCKLKNLVELASKPDRTWVARRVDLILVPQHQMPFALLGWIGSRMFNRSIRRYADKVMNMKLTSHGLYDLNKKEALAALCEEDVFQHLKLDYIKPSDRNC